MVVAAAGAAAAAARGGGGGVVAAVAVVEVVAEVLISTVSAATDSFSIVFALPCCISCAPGSSLQIVGVTAIEDKLQASSLRCNLNSLKGDISTCI